MHSLLNSLDLNLLVVLRALLTERHVTRAATRIGLSQSATSHALTRLRDLYGDALLVRSGRGFLLTPRAERLLPALERGLTDLSATLEAEPTFDPRTARNTFRLAAADYTQAVMLGPLLRTLEAEAPRVDLLVVNVPDIEDQTLSGRVDMGVQVTNRPSTQGVSTQHSFDDDFVCLVRPDHPRIRGQLTLERYLLERHVVVAPSGTAGSVVDTELAKMGLERRVATRVTNFLIAPIVVAETDYVSTMPRRLGVRLAERYGLRALEPPLLLPSFGFVLIWHPRLDLDPAQVWFRQMFARVCKSLPPLPKLTTGSRRSRRRPA